MNGWWEHDDIRGRMHVLLCHLMRTLPSPPSLPKSLTPPPRPVSIPPLTSILPFSLPLLRLPPLQAVGLGGVMAYFGPLLVSRKLLLNFLFAHKLVRNADFAP